jgi:hypothetical protein
MRTSFPDASNFITTGSFDPTQELAPQRSTIQIERPSMSGSTVLIYPHVRPSGN